MFTFPQCESDRVASRDRGKKVGIALGAVAGTAWGVACALRGVRTSALEDTQMGMARSLLASTVSATLAGLASGVTIGRTVGVNFPNTHVCLACCYTFASASHQTVIERLAGSAKGTT